MTGTNWCKSSGCFPPLNPPHTVYKVEKRGGKPLTPTTKRRKLHSPTTTHTWPHHDSLMIPSPHIFSQQNRTGTRPRPRGPNPQHSTDLRPHPPPPPPQQVVCSVPLPSPVFSFPDIPSHRKDPKVGRSSPVATLYSLANPNPFNADAPPSPPPTFSCPFLPPPRTVASSLLVRGASQTTKSNHKRNPNHSKS